MERSFGGSTWGPLGEHAEGFFAELAGLGYSRRSRAAHLRLMKDVSEWLGAQGLSAGDLTAEGVAELVASAGRGARLYGQPKPFSRWVATFPGRVPRPCRPPR